MATTTYQGSGVQFTDRRRFYLSPKVTKELWPVVTPFLTLIANGQTKTGLTDTSFKMFEHRNPWRFQYFYNNASTVTIGTNNVDSDAITIDNINGLASSVDSSYIGLVVEFWDSTETTLRGTALITAAPSSTTLKMRNLDGATSISTVDNDVIRVVGNAHGEGASSPEAWSDELRVVYNSTQEFRTPVEISKKLRRAALRGEVKELQRLNKIKSGEHKMQKDRTMMFGRSTIGTNLDPDSAETFNDAAGNGTGLRTDSSGFPVRTTMGIFTAIEKYGNSSGDFQNIFEVAEGDLTWGDYVDITEKIFQYLPNSGMMRAFCGRGAMSYWSKIQATGIAGNSGWKVEIGDMKQDKLGFNYRMLETPHGIVQLIPTPGIDGPRNKQMLIINEDNLFHAQYESPEFRQNIKTDNAPSIQKNEYFSDEGIGITLIESHSLFKIT